MGNGHSVPKEGGERLSDYLRREFQGKGYDADTLVVIALKDEQKEQQKDKKKKKGLWKQLTGRLSSKRSANKHDKNTKSHPAAKTTSAECNTQSVPKTSERETEKRDVETPFNNVNVGHRSSPEEKSEHLSSGTTSSQSERNVPTQNVEPTPSTSSHVERRYLRSGDSPVYQFNIPPKYDLGRPNSGLRGVRDMTHGTQPSWADRDFGSEPWEEDNLEHTDEVSQDHNSCDNESSRSPHTHVGGLSDETAYRVRGIAEELANLAFKISADPTKLVQDRNECTASSIVSDAHKTAIRGKKRNVDQATSPTPVEIKAQEAFQHNKSTFDTSATLRAKEAVSLDKNETKEITESHEVSCQTESLVNDTSCFGDVLKEKEVDNIGSKAEENGNVADTKEDANMVDNRIEINHNDKDLAYIAGIVAAGKAFSVGKAADVQKAAYLAGVSAVDAAYRMANETVASFADIRVADYTNSVKDNVEAETAAYLAGIRAVEAVQKKAEETAYMNGVKDAQELIRTKGHVESIPKRKPMSICILPEEKIEEDIRGKTHMNHMQARNITKSLTAEELTNEQPGNKRIVNDKVHENHVANDIDPKEVTSEKYTTQSANLNIGQQDEAHKFSVKNSENTEDVYGGIEHSFLKKNTHRSVKQFIKEADMPKHENEVNQTRGENVSDKSLNFPKSCDSVNFGNVENSEEIIAKSGFGDTNVDGLHMKSMTETELNDKIESILDRGEECSDIKELERMAEMIFEKYAPSVGNDKDIDSVEKDISKSLDNTSKENPQDTFKKNVKPIIDMATFDEMPIKKANNLSKQPWSDIVCDSEFKQDGNGIPQKTERDNEKFSKIDKKKSTTQKQDIKTGEFFVSLDSQQENTKKLTADEVKNNPSTHNVTGKPFIDMATFDDMPIKKAESLLRPPGKEMEFALGDHCSKPKLKKKKNRAIQNHDKTVDSLHNEGAKSTQEIKFTGSSSKSLSNELKSDTNNQLKPVHKENSAEEACFVSFDSQTERNKDTKNDRNDVHIAQNAIGTTFVDMATFDEMPIKRAEALLRPPGEETEFAPPSHFVKPKAKKPFKKRSSGTNKIDDAISTENGTKIRQESLTATDNNIVSNEIKRDTSDSNNIDEIDIKSKNGIVSFDSPTVDKGPKKCAKTNIQDTSKDNDRPFIDMSTFDDMPIKKADALLRPLGKGDEYKSEENDDNISGMVKSVNNKVKRLVRKKTQYGTVEHNKLIESDNAERKEKIESASATVDSFNIATKTINRPPKLTAKKAQYGSVAHNSQIKEGNELQKKKIGSIKTSLDTWKAKEVDVSSKRAEYGSVAHNNMIKMENSKRKKRMEEIHSNLDTWKAPNPGSQYSLQRKNEWEPVTDPGKFGSVAHFQQIKCNNAKRKKRMNRIKSNLDTWNRPNPGSMYSLKRKDEWGTVSDTRKYGSVAHYHQVKRTHGNNKQLIKGASSRISSWQPKSKMQLLNGHNQHGTGANKGNSQNRMSIKNTEPYNSARDISPTQNDHRVSSWSRYGCEERGENEDDMSNSYPRERAYKEYGAYPSQNNRQDQYKRADDVSYNFPREKKYVSTNNQHNQYRKEFVNRSSVTGEIKQQKQSKIPKLIMSNREDTFASSRTKVSRSSLASECNYGDRYREVNPLTVDPDEQSLNTVNTADYPPWKFQDSARSWRSRPSSCRSDGGSLVPVKKKEPVGKYVGMLHGTSHQTNELMLPTNDLRLPTNNLRLPTNNLRLPTNDLRQDTNDLRLPTNGLTHHTNDLRLPTNDLRLPTNDLRLSTNDLMHRSNDLRLHANDLRLPTNDLRLSTNDLMHGGNNLRLPTNDLRHQSWRRMSPRGFS